MPRVAPFALIVTTAALVACGSNPAPAPSAAFSPLPRPGADHFYQDVCWSPDGRRLACSERSEPDGSGVSTWRVIAVDLDGSNRRMVMENASWVTWSPDGSRLACSSTRDGQTEIFSIAADGSDKRLLTRHPSNDSQPAWSPLGDQIAFCSDRDGRPQIYVMSTDGSNVRRVTKSEGKDQNPGWSHDGARLVFYRSTGDARDQVYTINPDGSGEYCATHRKDHNIYPAFGPDGRILLSRAQPQGGCSLMAIDSVTGEAARLGTFSSFFGRWSPDGGRLVFISGEWPRAAVYTASGTGADVRKIVN